MSPSDVSPSHWDSSGCTSPRLPEASRALGRHLPRPQGPSLGWGLEQVGSKPPNCHLPGAGTRWAKPEPGGVGSEVRQCVSARGCHAELVCRISPGWGLLSSASLHHAISGWATAAGPHKTEDAGGWGGQQSSSGRGSVCEIRCVLSWVVLRDQDPHALLCPRPTPHPPRRRG